MTKEEAFKEINTTQDYYIDELINLFNSEEHKSFKVLNFTSATGTGKTKMMSKLINKLNNYFFIITTLSKGQLNVQIQANLEKDCKYNNFKVFGSCDYRINSKLTAEEILSYIPVGKECIWLRDEGHIKTNRFEQLLENKCYKVINFSATNLQSDIVCNFTNTLMLRTVTQQSGTPEDAINKLLEIKKIHKQVSNYNPCAIFRCIDNRDILNRIINKCEKENLKYINITTEDFDMQDLCEDNNEYDVIINKFKIVEGIDIRRAHVLYMDNQPSNNATTIQVIGRCRRNALLYRNDIDILAPKNEKLLEKTRQCFVYYNVENMKIQEDVNGELTYAFCDHISCQSLKPNTSITVNNGQLINGLYIIELAGETGNYTVEIDPSTGFNVIKPEGNFYRNNIEKIEHNCIWVYTGIGDFVKYNIEDIRNKLTLQTTETKSRFNYVTGELESETVECEPYYDINEQKLVESINYTIDESLLNNEKIKTYIKNKLNLLNMYSAIEKKNGKGYWYKSQLFKYSTDVKVSAHRLYSITKNANLTIEDIMKVIDDYFTEYKVKTKDKLLTFSESELLKYENFINDVLKTINKGICYNKYSKILKYNDKNVYSIHCYPYRGTEYSAAFKAFCRTHNCVRSNKIYLNDIDKVFYKNYTKIYNDKESAIIGTDLMHQIKDKDTNIPIWVESRSVSSKINCYNKFNTYLESKFKDIICTARNNIFTGKNKFDFDSKCNACLGYCVEYYSKYLVYGTTFLNTYLHEARKEASITDENFINNNLVIRACMLKYRDNMVQAFGEKIARVIQTISVSKLITESYAKFVSTVVDLGTKTAEFVKNTLYKNIAAVNNIDPNLSIKHIAGLADYITEDTILDIKTQNHISITNIKQVLAYYYLSTKRSDLNIKRVIVYDAVSRKSVTINL